jgi:hypothetical protein
MEPTFKDGEKAIFNGKDLYDWTDDMISTQHTAAPGGYILDNPTHTTVSDLKKRKGKQVTLELETYVELGDAEFEYYNMTFEDGLMVIGVNGILFTKIKENEKDTNRSNGTGG